MKKITTGILSILFCLPVFAQNMTVEQYIERFRDIAIDEMRRSGVPAAITLAQGILESENGNSSLTKRSNNHFGIKCKSYWTGESVSHDDDARGECFRKYPDAEQSFRDHSDFLRSGSHYAFLFSLKPDDYKGWSYGLKKAGYATNPRYPEILIKYIEKYNLQQYTLIAMSETSSENESWTDTAIPEEKDENSAGIGQKTKNKGVVAVYANHGTSLLAIASTFDIPLAKLMEYNDLDTEGLLAKDQWIYLERKLKSSPLSSHISRQGESLYSISQDYAIRLSELLAYNNVSDPDDPLTPGTEVWLQMKQELAAGNGPVVHEVKSKEGLYAISKKYHVSINEIKSLNNLSSDELKVGQRLIIAK